MIAINHVTLLPGELLFTTPPTKIRTILGSCVALTVWHPRLKIGGMCHFLMTCNKQKNTLDKNDFRYGIHALNQLLKEMKNIAPPQEYALGLFGGSKMFITSNSDSIGKENVIFAQQWLKEHHLHLDYENTQGEISRSLTLDLKSGEIKMRIYRAIEEELTHGN